MQFCVCLLELRIFVVCSPTLYYPVYKHRRQIHKESSWMAISMTGCIGCKIQTKFNRNTVKRFFFWETKEKQNGGYMGNALLDIALFNQHFWLFFVSTIFEQTKFTQFSKKIISLYPTRDIESQSHEFYLKFCIQMCTHYKHILFKINYYFNWKVSHVKCCLVNAHQCAIYIWYVFLFSSCLKFGMHGAFFIEFLNYIDLLYTHICVYMRTI